MALFIEKENLISIKYFRGNFSAFPRIKRKNFCTKIFFTLILKKLMSDFYLIEKLQNRWHNFMMWKNHHCHHSWLYCTPFVSLDYFWLNVKLRMSSPLSNRMRLMMFDIFMFVRHVADKLKKNSSYLLDSSSNVRAGNDAFFEETCWWFLA